MSSLSLKGALLAANCYLMLTACDSLSRLLMRMEVSQPQVLALVTFFGIIPLLLLMAKDKAWATLRPRHPWIVGVTVLIGCFEIGTAFYALRNLQYMVECYTLFFTMPLWTALLAVLFLKERISRFQLIAILVGFTGIVISNLPREGISPLGLGHLAALAAPILASLRILATRKLSQQDGGYGLILYLLIGIGIFNAVSIESFAPITWSMSALLLFAGLTLGVAHCSFLLAARFTPAPLLAPFQYTQAIWVPIFGILLFNEWPAWTHYAGLVFVVAGGIMLTHKSQHKTPPLAE